MSLSWIILDLFLQFQFFISFFTEQAAGYLESAAAGYESILSSHEETKLDSHIREFIVDQLTSCLWLGQRWKELYEFTLEEEKKTRVTIPLLSITSQQVAHIMNFYQTNDRAMIELSDWETLDDGLNGHSNDFSSHRLISLAENSLCHLYHSQKTRAKPYDNCLEDKCFTVIRSGLQESLRTRSHEHLNNFTVLNHICQKISNMNGRNKAEDTCTSLYVDKIFSSATLSRLLCWMEYFDSKSEIGQQMTFNLRLGVCSTNRKEGNLTVCERQLQTTFANLKFSERIGINASNDAAKFDAICHQLSTNDGVDGLRGVGNVWTKNSIRSVYETAKWLNSFPQQKERAIQFLAGMATSIGQKIECGELKGENLSVAREHVARSLLNLAEWIQPDNDKLSFSSKDKPLSRLVQMLDDPKMRHDEYNSSFSETNSILPSVDFATGKIIAHSLKQCPTLAKTWSTFGNWCYRWGRKVVEHRAEQCTETKMSGSDMTAIRELIPAATNEDIDRIVSLLNQHKTPVEDEDLLTANDEEEIYSAEIIEKQLRLIPNLSDCSAESLRKIIEIWQRSNRSTFCYYELAADAYFKYLQLTTTSTSNEDDSKALNSNEATTTCSTVTATLRILRLIVKHALELQQVLEKGLETTPSTPWKVS